MPTADLLVSCPVSNSVRVRQLSAIFDCPLQAKLEHRWRVSLPLEQKDWQIGLIVGPSGCGKSQIAGHLWPKPMQARFAWQAPAVIDDFPERFDIEEIANVCMAVGFNTIPSWVKPFAVLSNGEQFRVNLARALLESDELCVIDEFTSVVDRQVAQIGSCAVAKFIRKHPSRRFIAVTCHRDVTEWLQPDWTYDPSTQEFAWRSLRRRPTLPIVIGPVPYSAWRVFAPFHYLTADLNRSARCFGLWCDGQLASFAGMLWRPVNRGRQKIMGCSRLVTLPDFQGLGLAMRLIDQVSAIYGAMETYVHTYPAHPSLIRSFQKSANWEQRKKAGEFSSRQGRTSTQKGLSCSRPCAVFRYRGEILQRSKAQQILAYWAKG
jgi:ABC-type iron transport system FetAB ATPase subunit